MLTTFRTQGIALFAAIFMLVSISSLYAQNWNAYPDMPPSAASRKSIGEFLTPEGLFDLDAARNTGFQGSLDMEGCESGIDDEGIPVFRNAATTAISESPDDMYRDNSLSSSIPGANDDLKAPVSK